MSERDPEPQPAATPLRVAVADDELLARKRAVRLLEAMPGVDVVATYESADEVLARVSPDEVDVLVLDIQMPGLSGLDAGALLPDGPQVIFATAHPEHAVQAFALGVADYVLKPLEAGRLALAIERARARCRPRAAAPAIDPTRVARIPVTTRAGIVLVDPADISHAVFDGTLVTLHTRSGEAHLFDGTLQDLQDRVPTDRFERVHRRALVNLEAVALLQPNEVGGFTAAIKGGGEVPVSRQSARRLRRWLGM